MKQGVKQLYVISFKNNLEKRIWKKIYNCWYCHNTYCYDPASIRYYCYGQLGWKVCDEWNWYNPEGVINFYNWAKQFIKTKEDMSLYLDKDGLDKGLKLMRPESCRWITNSENVREKNLRHRKEQQEICRKIGKANKGKKLKITEEDRKRRSERMKQLNKNKDYKKDAVKISNTLKEYWKKKKQEQ